MKTLKITFLILFGFFGARGQNYLNIGPINAGSSTGRISVSGQTAELSIANRAVSSHVNNPTLGERWVIYNNGTSTDGRLRFWTGGDKVTFTKEGSVGIGTSSPSKLLDVNGDAKIGNLQSRHYFKISSNAYPEIRYETPSGDETIRLGMAHQSEPFYLFDDQDFYIWTAETNSTPLLVKQNGNIVLNAKMGNVGIGTTTPDAKLTVKGDIHAERVKVDLNIPAPDYVFEADYDLRSLEETASYIQENKHLPEVPSAKELEASGIDLVEMNMLLLKKIEELTLHVIEQNRSIKNLQVENKEIKKQLERK
ncbi:MAG: hypothetical protein ABJO02_18435 [Reichenbachiella sp.]|uniref:hypothetical protein n=1 Tax=Reichenbachiella sp. TaxID=2184521 RepID=UPI00329A7DFF